MDRGYNQQMIAVTGASGFAGGNLLRALLAENQPCPAIRALVHRGRRAIAGLEVEQVDGDVTILDSLMRAFNGVDVVYHLAGSISLEMNSWPELEAINIIGTRNVVEACLRCKVRRLVHFSSIHAVEQEPFDCPVDENNPLVSAPDHPPYDRSKAAGEREVRAGIERGLDAVILRPTGMIGPYDFQPSFFGEGVLLMAHGLLPALVEGGFDWVDVRDVAIGAIAAANCAPPGASYLLGGHWHSVREVAEIIAALSGRRAPLWTAPMGLAQAAAPLVESLAHLARLRPIFTRATLRALHSNHTISHARAARELGYCPRPFAETLADIIAWLQATGRLETR
ncbi:MAG: NAD-dependent epimerase/dehydratase family protein [Anaerolineaceae bacterium]|nr:NAD-dependent epimerase/dehydratase family protein [Anaerolineaceae bacterium]